jgi:hypothetical protein
MQDSGPAKYLELALKLQMFAYSDQKAVTVLGE